jgi:hypothetical protein
VAASIAVESSGGGFRRGGEPVVVSAPTCIEFRAGWRKGKRGERGGRRDGGNVAGHGGGQRLGEEQIAGPRCRRWKGERGRRWVGGVKWAERKTGIGEKKKGRERGSLGRR